MIASHIHHALAQVQELKVRVLNSQQFTGYSGRCRAVGGTIALCTPLVLGATWFPQTTTAHLWAWALVSCCAILANYSAVLYWFLFHSDVERDIRRLMPTVDAFPSLGVGGILTGALIRNGQHDLLFGMWMCLYGLTNLSARYTLPKALWPLGVFYIACGATCLCVPWVSFTSPWPMGLVFGVGELAGGFIFHRNRIANDQIRS
ncbi:MAG: hypothetical protein HQ515_08280 [Phycisphaeraceae bacterium]|nr:hypothetical protein [Phycisphaeraceae bacterium]